MKILLVILIVALSGWVGYRYKLKHIKQLNALKEILNYSTYIKDNLTLFKNNIEEIHINYINTHKNKNANNIQINQNNINNMQKYLQILQKDIFELELKILIQNYFDQIGKSEYEFEFDKIKNFISVIEDKIKIAEENKKQKGDLYFKLSLAVGVVIGVLIWWMYGCFDFI